MPLKLNLGLSRKVGEANYGSRGASINLEMEIDSSLASEPVKLHDRIRQLFGLVRISLAEELYGNGNGHAATSGNVTLNSNGHGSANGNGQSPSNSERPRPATAAQIKAITTMAQRQKIDLIAFLKNRIGVGSVADLTLKQASQVIDELKAGISAEE